MRDGDAIPLASRVLVGRAATATLQLDDKRVSGEHAVLTWSGRGWSLRDLGSRNGTFVGQRRLEAGETHVLTPGDRLGFGAPDERWLLHEAGAPGPIARALDGDEVLHAFEGILALPAADAPEVVVYADARGQWTLERGDEGRAAADGELVEAGGRPWRLVLPAAVDGTATVDIGPVLDTVTLRFAVSMDEEHVQITVVHQGRLVPLEPREHAYALLTLARQRIEDRELPLAEQGWVDRDQLLKWLQVDANGLNVAIYRARNQLAAAGVDGAAGIVEVRRGQRRLGIEPARIEVGPLG